ncbi:ribosome biogenesis GTP-binding protein YihA/YsxC [Campylobacter upsaliensis]|uniref:ribosome biogenesis GTP-binding protein YihA/YsxC n=1 Tax=Campylobacter upsaliensis TaxID=28080 RepID=UPI0012795EBF|nr:ribosome biogenesis GTP-binding protein YihA/YsxC [Campylobacter upsaliensis]EAH8207936.1 YihA family ribosome biogenesis GTP-binding protein [Campylobacter upsaliensis]EAI3921153.1 YihA family ribosome biogenesis GTP-binding protein [Campylobacter upsaliensis]EAI5602330.1 YihA family ribosome biogenesis GTP-binding protein [Campylobacter upsaliensis]EAJ2423463.1 YihA family ribosome biogenesis GTP-binding protein [Campylobacter upsaliensis]EAJ7131207.1 YihA family ribosome biogenesis GTP-b
MISNATFLTSLAKFDPNFEANCAEVAFLGRSNVGKSSLINTLCKQKKLAKSSSTPGKTQLINFFEIKCKKNEEEFKIHFIDLPGFGYAKVSKNLKEIWNKNLDEFLKLRTSIKLFLHLIDARHTNLEIDLSVDAYLKSFLRGDQQILKIFTKADKLNQSQKARLKNHFENSLLISNLNKSGLALLENIILEKTLGL